MFEVYMIEVLAVVDSLSVVFSCFCYCILESSTNFIIH